MDLLDGVALPDEEAPPGDRNALLANLGLSAFLSVEEVGVRKSSAD